MISHQSLSLGDCLKTVERNNNFVHETGSCQPRIRTFFTDTNKYSMKKEKQQQQQQQRARLIFFSSQNKTQTQISSNHHYQPNAKLLRLSHVVFLVISNQFFPPSLPLPFLSLFPFFFSLVFKDACKRISLVREGK